MNSQDLLSALGRSSLQAGVLVLLILLAQWLFQNQLRQRIRMIAGSRPGKSWRWFSVVLLTALALIGLTDAQPAKPGPTASTAVSPSGSEMTNLLGSKLEERIGADPVPEITDTNSVVRTLSVTVLDPAGNPLPRAEVQAPYAGGWTKSQPKRLTDANGRFTLRFPTVPADSRRQMSNFSISAGHTNFARRATMWTSSGGDVYSGMPETVTIRLEQGTSIGGVVQDEQGLPVRGVRVLLQGSGYRGFTMGNTERKTHEYSELWLEDLEAPAAITDAAGRWVFDRFPVDLKNVEVAFVRPDGSRETYATSDENGLNRRPQISLQDLQDQKLITRLREGVTVRGIVVDEEGKPLSGVTVREGYGHGNIVRTSEFTTDATGRFERGHRAPRQWIYTAMRADRATASVVAQVETGMSEVRIVLPPAQPWVARVTDETGQPVADAIFRLDTYRTEGQILDWSAETDADGRANWTNAPLGSVTCYVMSKSSGASRKIRLARGQAEQSIVLSKAKTEGIVIQVKALDAGTRKPVTLQSVAVRYEGGGSPFKPLMGSGGEMFSAQIKRSDFRVGMYPSYELRIEAEGYETFTTEMIDFDLGDQSLEPALNRSAGSPEVAVLQPDGTPAGGARLWTRAKSEDGSLFINAPGRYYGDRMSKAQADDKGRLKLPGVPESAPVVIIHSNSFLQTTLAEIRHQKEVRLEAFGVLTGRLLVAGKPKGGASISLSTLSWSPTLGYHLSYSTTTDPDGRFTFTQVPAGKFKLYRWDLPKRRDTAGMAITETSQMPVTVAAGATNSVEYARTGRPVVGQAIPVPADFAVDWQNDIHTLSLKLPSASGQGRPNREDYATFEAFRIANDASFRSEYQIQAANQVRTYRLEFETDGSFRIEDVPPGTYEVRIGVSKPGESSRSRPFGSKEEIGSLTREIIVPEGKETLELGTLPVPMRGERPAQSAPPMALSATTFDGKPLTLAQFKGRHVLLVFWASWSERSLEQFAQLRQVQAEHASDARLVLVGINLDDSRDAAQKILKAGDYTWPQAWLDAGMRAKMTGAFDVSELPAIFLLDPDGRVVARDLENDRLPAALKRALAKK
jgi:protocatechuate 3,4-dioxygenase beta subunit/thiol-disulfide isomerase/thioredoxin